MEGFLHHMAPQFLHPALQSFGCGAFRPIGGAFHPLYPGKAFARHLGEQYALGQSVGQALRQSVRDESSTPPLYRHGYGARDDTSSPGSAASASPRPCKDDEPPASTPCTDSHDFFSPDGERKSSCGVCGARLGPGVAQAHFLQELQHLYSLSALPRDVAPSTHSMHHQDEDARWETYQRIRANRQRRLKLRTRKRHHTVESMLGYDLDEERERREERPREPRTYDAEDEPVDVEGDSLGWPDAPITVDDTRGYDLDEERLREPRGYDAEDEPVDVEGDSLGWPDAPITVDGKTHEATTWMRSGPASRAPTMPRMSPSTWRETRSAGPTRPSPWTERPREPRGYDAEDEPVDVEGDSLGWPDAPITVDDTRGYDLDEERPREPRGYDAEDEPVDVEGDSLGWPDAPITVDDTRGYDLDEERPREPRGYDAEDEPVDVEGDSLGWPDAPITVDGKRQRGYDLDEERLREPRGYDAEDEPVDVEGDSLGWPDAPITVDGKTHEATTWMRSGSASRAATTPRMSPSTWRETRSAGPTRPSPWTVRDNEATTWMRSGSASRAATTPRMSPSTWRETRSAGPTRPSPWTSQILYPRLLSSALNPPGRLMLTPALQGAHYRRRCMTYLSTPQKEQRMDNEKLHLSYAEDLEISSTNDAMQSPERVRIETPKPLSLECAKASEPAERPPEVSTSEPWPASVASVTAPPADAWPALAAEAYLQATRHKIDGENLPSSTDSRN
ncbi:E3 ubiquitin-protein ligase [Phthorimaea operculella]|nr:E3 ubiquitin-protein ligase [Phthorimaea operculella]